MIRKEVERLRGLTFTKEELQDIILPIMRRAFPTEEDLVLRLSPNITLQNGGLECIIEFEDRDFKFEFEHPISHVIQLANSEKGCHKKKVPTEKRLWKARSVCVYKTLPIPHTTDYTDMMELTVDEAVSWYKEWAEHLNDCTSDEFTVYANGLFYKKDGEWIRYRIGGNNER